MTATSHAGQLLAGLGERLRRARRKRRVTQKALARTCNISAQAVSDWEVGRYDPSAVNVVRAALALSVSLDWLMLARGDGP